MIIDQPSVLSCNPLNKLSPNPVMLAPMVGLTHYAVRAAVQKFLPKNTKALWPTEMLNSRRIPSQHENENPEIYFYDKAQGLCPQLLANDEEFIRMSVPRLEAWGARAIDINMGCPVTKALKHNYGVALMGDPVFAAQVVKWTVAHATAPVSVKLRAGFDKEFQNLVKFIAGLYEAGASWVTIHPRTAEQQRKGKPDFKLVYDLKKIFNDMPIVCNGDVECGEDIEKMFQETNCDRVMVGRAMMAKPWLIRGELDPGLEEQGVLYGQFLATVIDECMKYYSFKDAKRRILFLLNQGKAWIEFGEYLQGRMQSSLSFEEMLEHHHRFFSCDQKLVKRTALRT